MLNAMNHLNRAIVTLLLLAISILGLSLGIALVHDLLSGRGINSGSDLSGLALNSVMEYTHRLLILHGWLVAGVSVIVAVLAALLLWGELKNVVASPQLILSRSHLGQVAISLDQVGILAQHEAETIPGVREARTVAESKKAGIEVQQMIAVEPKQLLPALAEEIQQRVKRSLEYHLGFPVVAVRIQLQQASLSKALL